MTETALNALAGFVMLVVVLCAFMLGYSLGHQMAQNSNSAKPAAFETHRTATAWDV